MENFSLEYFILYKRKDSFYYDKGIWLNGFILSWIWFMLSCYLSIHYRSNSFYHSNKHVEWNHFFLIDNERFSLVCFIIYKREDSFHHDLLQTHWRDSLYHGWDSFSSWYSIRYRSDSFCTIAINLLNEIMFLIILIQLIMRGSVSCALLSIKQRTRFISIYCIRFKGFTLSWIGFILSWYSIRYRSDSFHHSNKPVNSNHFFFDYFH